MSASANVFPGFSGGPWLYVNVPRLGASGRISQVADSLLNIHNSPANLSRSLRNGAELKEGRNGTCVYGRNTDFSVPGCNRDFAPGRGGRVGGSLGGHPLFERGEIDWYLH